MLIDTHVHLNDKRLTPLFGDVASSFQRDGLEAVINVGYDRPSSEKALSQAAETDNVYCALGVHPHDAKMYGDADGEYFLKQSAREKVVAIGEIGLDYYRDLSPREAQKEVFIKQLEVADAAGLPVIIHLRDAAGDMLEILKSHKSLYRNGIVLHCFSETPEYMKAAVRLGAYISFAGPVTFANSRHAVECAKLVPDDRFLIETDCPYLAPEPKRGQMNIPAYVRYVAQRLAEIRKVDFEEIERQSANNAKALFKKIR